MTSTQRSRRLTRIQVLVPVAVLIAAVGIAAPVRAAVNCNGLQAALDAATDNAVIVLDGLCTGQSFALKPGISITLTGLPGAGFDGTGAPARVLTGDVVGNVTITGLRFANSVDQTGEGGAVRLRVGPGATVHIQDSTFDLNESNAPEEGRESFGGAVYVDTCRADPNEENDPCKLYGDGRSTFISQESTYTRNVADNGGAIAANVEESFIQGNPEETEFSQNLARLEEGGAVRFVGDTVHISTTHFDRNSARTLGGAAAIFGTSFREDGPDVPASVAVVGSLFTNNHVGCGDASALGGAIYLAASFESLRPSVFTQLNRFDSNRAGPVALADCILAELTANDEGARNAGVSGDKPGGGGAWFEDAQVVSINDRYTNNVVEGTHGVGGGIGVQSRFHEAGLEAHNLAVAGNQIVGSADRAVILACEDCHDIFVEVDPSELLSFDRGIGGGIYAGSGASSDGLIFVEGTGTITPPPEGPTTLVQLLDSTVAGNHTPVSGSGEGIGSHGGNNTLLLDNSIVYTSGTTNDITGFALSTVRFSDACSDTDTPAGPAADGNICAAPMLVNPEPGTADVHQTDQSPTLDKGSNALVDPDLGQDYETDARIQDVDGDGVSVVDMGADEARGKQPTCPGDPSCHEGPFGDPTCEDGKDNDGNGQTDDEDPKCMPGKEGPPGHPNCSDAKDNDGDGDVDGDDRDCVDVEGEKLPPTGVGVPARGLAIALLVGASGLAIYQRRFRRGARIS